MNKSHIFYKTSDKDSPEQVLDRNGEVALNLCRVCNQAEGDLEEFCQKDIERCASWCCTNYKHEGEFIDSTGIVQPLSYHYGTIGGLITHELNMTLPVSTTPKIVTITFNLNKIYRSPNVVDLNGNNIHSGVPGWIQTMKENFPGSFELTGIQ